MDTNLVQQLRRFVELYPKNAFMASLLRIVESGDNLSPKQLAALVRTLNTPWAKQKLGVQPQAALRRTALEVSADVLTKGLAERRSPRPFAVYNVDEGWFLQVGSGRA